jgi:hypothetical protein
MIRIVATVPKLQCQITHLIFAAAGFGDGNVQTADGKNLLHTQQPVSDGQYFFTAWNKRELRCVVRPDS